MPVVTKAQVINIRNISENVREFLLCPEKKCQYEAGQFLQLTLEDVTASDYWPESRTFSIASYKTKDKTIRLIIKRVGVYTARIFNEINIGDKVTIKYAYGDFTLPMFDTTSEIVCIAGGTGIAPFLSFIDALEEEVSLQEEASLNRIRLLYSIKHRKDAIDLDILKSKVKKFKLFITREQHNDSINRRIQIEDIIAEEAEEYKDLHYYISGSKDFINNYKQLLQLKKVNNIYTDEWI